MIHLQGELISWLKVQVAPYFGLSLRLGEFSPQAVVRKCRIQSDPAAFSVYPVSSTLVQPIAAHAIRQSTAWESHLPSDGFFHLAEPWVIRRTVNGGRDLRRLFAEQKPSRIQTIETDV